MSHRCSQVLSHLTHLLHLRRLTDDLPPVSVVGEFVPDDQSLIDDKPLCALFRAIKQSVSRAVAIAEYEKKDAAHAKEYDTGTHLNIAI